MGAITITVDPTGCVRCRELEAEVVRLRAENRQLSKEVDGCHSAMQHVRHNNAMRASQEYHEQQR